MIGSGKELGRNRIVAIITLYKEGYKCKDIATCVGIGVQQVQKWTKKFRDRGGDAHVHFLSFSAVLLLPALLVQLGRRGAT